MTLKLLTYILLPAHLTVNPDGFDHAAVSEKTGKAYVAHTANDTVELIDIKKDTHVSSLKNLKAVAGALVSDEKGLIFTSNRGENTVSVFPLGKSEGEKVPVGNGPNGLAYDPNTNLLLAGNTGKDPSISIVDVGKKKMIANIPVPSRTRWAIFDPKTNNFFVNIKEPAEIAVISAKEPTKIASLIKLPEKGPHGLDIDSERGRLFCACDNKKLLEIDIASHNILSNHDISGAPDVIFYNAALKHLYVTIEDPGVVDVFDTSTMKKIEAVKTEEGAHTMAFDKSTNKVYVFLPKSHRAEVFADSGENSAR